MADALFLRENPMLRKTSKNIILALCISGILIAVALYQRHTASSVALEAFYIAAAVFFLLKCRICRKQCGA